MNRLRINCRTVLVLSVLVLAGSVWLNCWLVLKVLDYKGRLFLAYEFPDDVPLPPVSDARSVVWLAGDSRIASWTLPETAERRVVNRGVSGFTARQTLDRWRMDIAAGNKPRTLIIQAGINDVMSSGYNRHSRLPSSALVDMPGRPGPEKIMQQCATDLKQLVDSAVAADCQVILMTVFPPGPYALRDRFFWTAEMEEKVTVLNAFLKGLNGPNVTLLDAAAMLSSGGRTKAEYSSDCLHLNSAGYSVLTSAAETELARISPARAGH